MRRFNYRAIAFALVVAALFVVPSVWAGAPGAAPGTPLASPGPTGSPFAAAAPAASPHPGIVCPPFFPTWTQVGSPPVWPLVPDQINQIPCPKISIDEVHATFSSPTASSGQRWTIPVHVPVDANTYQLASYPQFYVGMVTNGDAFSEWDQTYSEIVFQPNGAPVSSYTASVHIIALVNQSFEPYGCPGMGISWNNSFYCVLDDMTGPNSSVNVNPGDWLDVTFAGDRMVPTGLDVWLNDTTTPANFLALVLNTTNTGTGDYNPFYDASCVDTCMLKWGVKMSYGLGVGFTMCPFGPMAFASCDSYNDTTYNGTNPVEFGIPHFWLNGGYNGDYRYFAPVSTSGVCNGFATTGTVAQCFNQDTLGGTGYYPSFSYNGTVLDFGVSRSWTTQDWGGTIFELLSTAAPNDLTPFYFSSIANDSRAGFVASGGTITVTTHLQDLGNVRYAGVAYRVNAASAVSIPMTLMSGTRNDGVWDATIPTGPDGWVNFTVNATNNASAQLLTPAAGSSYHVQRGPLPTFAVQVLSSLGTCGGVKINGVLHASGTFASLSPGTYPILGVGCYPYQFSGWSLTPGITIAPTGALNGQVTISAAGTIQATWYYVRPLDTVVLYTNPQLCGVILLGGTGYTPNATGEPVQVLDAANVSLGATGCGGYSFSGWNFTGNFTILGTNFVAGGNGSLYANFVLSTSAFQIIFHTLPATCGGILFQGAGYTDGQSLSELAGNYAIAGDPCYHFGLLQFTTTGQLSIANGVLTVSGSGTITETNYVLTIVTFHTSPPNCGTITWDGVDYTDGQSVVVANNSTHSVTATPCANHYLFSITGTDGVSVTGNIAYVNGSGSVTAAFFSGSPTQFVGFLTDPSMCGAIYLAGVRYTSSNYTYVATGSQATVSAQPCSAYGFVKWITFGDITILNSTAYLNGPGAIEAIFRPLATIFVYTSPYGCGTIEIANTSYASNSTLQLTEYRSYTLGVTPCTGYGFSSWVNSSGAMIAGGTITLTTGSVLTAVFLPVRYSVGVTINPPRCGGVRISGQDVGNGTVLTLAHGTYPIQPAPCTGDHLVRWDITGGLAITNTTLWVNGTGTVLAVYQPVLPTLTLDLATGSFAGILVPFGATVAVLVPPYTYTFTWTFGDGAVTSTPVNFTSHSYASPGFYHVNVMVTDPYNRSANATGTIQVVAQGAVDSFQVAPLAIAGIAIAVIALLAIVLIGSRFRRPPAEPTPSLLPPSPPSPLEGDATATDSAEMEPPKP